MTAGAPAVAPARVGTLGVVVVHEPSAPVDDLASVRGLRPQVDELLVVANGPTERAGAVDAGTTWVEFETNRGTAAAWNEGLRTATERGHGYMFLLDQDSVPGPDAVATARAEMAAHDLAAVVQPVRADRLGLDPFPMNTVASGSLYRVEALNEVGGFDERLFVDEVDHELLVRLARSGYRIAPLSEATIDHEVGSPRRVTALGLSGQASGHGRQRRHLQGYSAGILARRLVRHEPAAAARLVLRQALTAGKDVVARQGGSALALVAGAARGAATRRPPTRAATRACPFCRGPLLGLFASVPDWIFGNGRPADYYRCARCGALATGQVPTPAELASWYSEYYTHQAEEPERHRWSRWWPTPARSLELRQMRRYFSADGETGRFLEVGTGSGERLIEFADAGWDVVGQDVDPAAGRRARARGLTVHTVAVDELVGREAPFDLIGLSHVLEHAVDPENLLTACAQLLAPGGRICVICPNAHASGRWIFGRWWFGLDPPRHLSVPTVAAMGELTAGLGLEVIELRTAATNAAVILGGSMARGLYPRLPAGAAHRVVRFSTALLGQVVGRAALVVHDRLGEEVVWIGQRARA